MDEGQNLLNDVLEANDNSYDEGTTSDFESETEETTSKTEEQTESDDSEWGETITLTRAELEEREREIKREQDRRWKERIKGLEGKESSHESGKENKSQEGVASKEELDRFRLETKGIEDKAQQDFVLKYAKIEGISVNEAINDDVVKAKLEKLSADQVKNRATGTPINRTGKPREKSPEEMARELETKGAIPKTPEQRKAVLKALQQKYGRT